MSNGFDSLGKIRHQQLREATVHFGGPVSSESDFENLEADQVFVGQCRLSIGDRKIYEFDGLQWNAVVELSDDGFRSVIVADVDDPSSELSALSPQNGDFEILEVVQADDFGKSTMYRWSSVGVDRPPYVVPGDGGKWIAFGGRFNNDGFEVNSGESVAAYRTEGDGTALWIKSGRLEYNPPSENFGWRSIVGKTPIVIDGEVYYIPIYGPLSVRPSYAAPGPGTVTLDLNQPYSGGDGLQMRLVLGFRDITSAFTSLAAIGVRRNDPVGLTNSVVVQIPTGSSVQVRVYDADVVAGELTVEYRVKVDSAAEFSLYVVSKNVASISSASIVAANDVQRSDIKQIAAPVLPRI